MRPARRAILLAGLLHLFAGGTASAQFIVSDSVVGYIDSAIPGTQLRLRFDAGYNTPFPDRAEFQYAKYNNPGPPLSETAINSHQELSPYFEYAPTDRFSLFAELPTRWINPERNDNTGGLYDMTAGFKFAMVESDVSVFSFQLKTYAATGDISSGLSAGHASIEPGLLYFGQLTQRVKVEGEVRDWIPIDASETGPGGGGGSGGGGGGGAGLGGQRNFGGNVLRYGIGLGYLLHDCEHYSATSVTELVGWHVFDGLKSTPSGQRISSDGDSILNLKMGLRFGFGDWSVGCSDSSSLFMGYGVALTDDKWYSEILRTELRLAF